MITVEDTDPVRSATIANLLPEIFRRQSSALQAQRFVDTKAGLDGQLNSVRADIVETRAALAAAQAAEDSSEGSRLEASLQQFQAAEGSLVKSLNDVRLEEAKTTNSLYPIEPAEVPVDPIRPRTAQNTLLAALVGAMLAIGVVLLLEYLNDVLQSPDDVQTSLGLTTLASVPLLTGSPLDAVTMNQRGQTAGGEAYRVLRTNLQFAALGRPLRVLQITSPSPSEGKSLTSTNLAIALAQNGQRVILVDCDLRKPHLHHLLNLPNSIGLTIALLDADATPATFLQESGMPGLQVMTSGPLPPNPAEILGTSRMREVLAGLAAEADVLLLDSPPTLAVADAAILASQVDGVLFVVDASSTRREQARQALLSLEQVQVRPVGVVLNRVPQRRSGYYYYYSHNDYGDGEDTGRRRGRRRWPWQKTFRRETQEEAGAVALDS